MTGVAPAIDLLPTLAVLVVACPCALVLATPAAVLAATARLAQRGRARQGGRGDRRARPRRYVRLRQDRDPHRGQARAGRLHRAAADRMPTSATSQDEVLRLAAAAEQPSEHPLARLLVAEAERRGLALPAIDDFQAQPGAGVLARLKLAGPGDAISRDGDLLVGNLRLVREHGVRDRRPRSSRRSRRSTRSGQTAADPGARRPGRRA